MFLRRPAAALRPLRPPRCVGGLRAEPAPTDPLPPPPPRPQNQLVDILSTKEFHPIIRWNQAGNGFIIMSIRGFENTVLPKKYKHAHYSSFLRSLCYYGFTRASGDSDTCEYTHPVMHRDHPERTSSVRGGPPLRWRNAGARASPVSPLLPPPPPLSCAPALAPAPRLFAGL